MPVTFLTWVFVDRRSRLFFSAQPSDFTEASSRRALVLFSTRRRLYTASASYLLLRRKLTPNLEMGFYELYREYPAPILAIPGNHDGVVYSGGPKPTLTAGATFSGVLAS